LVLINVYKQLGLGPLGCFKTDPILLEEIHSAGALLIDNAALYTGDNKQPEPNKLTNPAELWLQTQRNLDQWSDLLQASGGALKPKKCFWYSLDYKCKAGIWSYVDTSDFELKIINADGKKIIIEQKTPTMSMETLGVNDAPAGGNVAHLEYLSNKSKV
jgi:hypothetical protein